MSATPGNVSDQTDLAEFIRDRGPHCLIVARHSETDEELVVYRPEYGDGSLWVRPLAMFQEMVTVEGKELLRFQFLRRDGEQR